MPRITIFITKEVANEVEAKTVIDSVKQLADIEIKKAGTIVSATYQKEM